MNGKDHGNNVDNDLVNGGLFLKFKESITLVGAGEVSDAAFNLSQTRAKIFVGADGGGDEVLRRGADLHAVIGDLDSLSSSAKAAIPSENLLYVAEQDSTDFEKALTRIEAPLIYALGFTGARLDHELAAFHGLVRFPSKRIVLIGSEDIIVHVPARLQISLPSETRVSLFPMDGVRVGIEGLKWSFAAIDLHPARRIGTSNRALGGAVELCTDRPGCLLIVPLEAVDAVTEGLAEADFHSPPA
jgi:thiamine pyrophosphokinase